jgi:hypothetical protein
MNEVMTSFSARVPKRLIDSLKDEAWERRVSLAQLVRDLFEQVYADRQVRLTQQSNPHAPIQAKAKT